MKRQSYNTYLKHCKECLTNEELFLNFKSKSAYRIILEHVKPNLGNLYIKVGEEKFSNYLKKLNWDKILENDKIGNPRKHNFVQLRKYTSKTEISPTTIRYIITGLEILSSYKKKNPENKNLTIVEVGGGYGGQCKVLHDMAYLFDLTISSYLIFDYDIVCNLQKKYLARHNLNNINFSYFDEKKKVNINNFDLFISNYALGEVNKVYQNWYIKNVICKARNIYIIWNLTPLHNYFNNNCFIITGEKPQTGTNNRVIINKEKINL